VPEDAEYPGDSNQDSQERAGAKRVLGVPKQEPEGVHRGPRERHGRGARGRRRVDLAAANGIGRYRDLAQDDALSREPDLERGGGGEGSQSRVAGMRTQGAQPSSVTLSKAARKTRRGRFWATTGDRGRIVAPGRGRPQGVSRPSSDCDPGPGSRQAA
jgi:hypothetical protein